MKILLVEDSPSDALFATRALKMHSPDSDVFHVKDGVEAMDFLNQRSNWSDAAGPESSDQFHRHLGHLQLF